MPINWPALRLALRKGWGEYCCAHGRHAWRRSSGSLAYQAGYETRACERCPASQIYAPELGRYVDDKL